MLENSANWVAEMIQKEPSLRVLEQKPEGFLLIERDEGSPFLVAAMGVRNDSIEPGHVRAFLRHATPAFFVNVPSKTLWSGAAISIIHSTPAAFGKLGEISKAADHSNVASYRNKEWKYFETAFQQHTNVSGVIRIYDEVFLTERRRGKAIKIALVHAYNMSAEDVRNARERFGPFDVALKTTSYGSITTSAASAAASIGAEALTIRELYKRLAKT